MNLDSAYFVIIFFVCTTFFALTCVLASIGYFCFVNVCVSDDRSRSPCKSAPLTNTMEQGSAQPPAVDGEMVAIIV